MNQEPQPNRVTRGTVLWVIGLLLAPLPANLLAISIGEDGGGGDEPWVFVFFGLTPLCGIIAAVLLARQLAGTWPVRTLKGIGLGLGFVALTWVLGFAGCALTRFGG
jgi:hypothetical protein